MAGIFALAAIVESVSPTPAPKVIDCLVSMVLCIGIAGLAHNGRHELAANLLAIVVAIVVNWLLWNSVIGSYNIVGWALPVVVMFSVLSCRRAVAITLTSLQCVSFIWLMVLDAPLSRQPMRFIRTSSLIASSTDCSCSPLRMWCASF
jgi:hypothetical protein